MSTEQLVNEFFTRIDPFLSLWESLHIVSAAIQWNGNWFNLCSRLEFRVNGGQSASEFCLSEKFKLIWKEVPAHEAKGFLMQLVGTNQIRFKEDEVIHLYDSEQQGSQMPHWWGPKRFLV